MASALEETARRMREAVRRNNANVLMYAAFATASLLVYWLLSSGDFSFLLTYASFLRCFGFLLLVYKMYTTNSAKGVSAKTLQLYACVFFLRLLSILRHQGYLPYDKSGDWFYHVVEFCSMGLVGVALWMVMAGPFRSTYNSTADAFGALYVPSHLGAIWILVPCIVFGMFVHPSLNNEWFADSCWSIAMYIETLAILPQLSMFIQQAKSSGSPIVEVLISHFVFIIGFARVAEMLFWLSSYQELSVVGGNKAERSNWIGGVVLVSQFIHILLMADFYYYYFVSVAKGNAMTLPTSV